MSLHVTGLFPYSLKKSDNQRFSDVFRGYRKKPLAWCGLIYRILCWICLRYFRQQYSTSITPEIIRKPEVFDVFRGYKNRSVPWNGLIQERWSSILSPTHTTFKIISIIDSKLARHLRNIYKQHVCYFHF